MGGSFASTGNEASVFARYHFRPHFHQHAGFRVVAPSRREEATHFVTSCTGQSVSSIDRCCHRSTLLNVLGPVVPVVGST